MKKVAKPAPATESARRQAVIYARVSSKEQEKEGFSIPAQLKLLRDYAAANGFAVAQEYVDVETAKQTGRAAFGEMVAYLKTHPSRCLVPACPGLADERTVPAFPRRSAELLRGAS